MPIKAGPVFRMKLQALWRLHFPNSGLLRSSCWALWGAREVSPNPWGRRRAHLLWLVRFSFLMRNFLPFGEWCFPKFVWTPGHMTQFLHWTMVVFKNVFSVLLSMTSAPHHEVISSKVVTGEWNLWVDVCLGRRAYFCLSLCVPFIRFSIFKLSSLFMKPSEKMKSLYNSTKSSLDIPLLKVMGYYFD